jgi:hypothetical protein
MGKKAEEYKKQNAIKAAGAKADAAAQESIKKILDAQLIVKNSMADATNKAVQRAQKLADIESAHSVILTNMASNASKLSELKDKKLQSQVRINDLSNANLASEQALYNASNKQKMIHDQNYQTGLLMAETKDGIVDAEEAILKIIRDKKKLEDPLYKAKQDELDILKKKEAYEDKAKENSEKIKGFFQDIAAAAADPSIAMGVFSAVMLKNATEFASTMGDVGGDMGLSRDQSMQMAGDLGVASIKAFAFGISAKEIGEAFAGVSDQMGSMTPEMVGMAENAAHMAKRLKLSGAEAGKLFALTHMIEGGTAETAEASLKTVENLARGANVPIGKVMKDVANSADLIADYGFDNVEALGKAAVEAAKMGTSLDQMAKTADKLMDLDSARNDAMQLSVLLGRQVNVDKAQQLIYNGDLEGGYKEMLNQLGGIDAFNKMDYYQKKKAAELMGLSTGDLQKQLNLAAGLTETGEKQAEGWAKTAGFLSDGWGFAQKNAETIVATMALTKSLGNLKVVQWAKEKAHMLWKKAFGGGSKVAEAAAGPMKADGTPDMRFKANKMLKPKAPKAPKLPGKSPKVAGPMGDADKMGKGGKQGIGAKMKDLAEGLREMGKGTFKGILAMALAGPALIVALPSIPFLLFMGKATLSNIGENMRQLAAGLKEMGQNTFMGIAAMALAGPAMLLSIPAIPFLLFFGLIPLSMLETNFSGLSKGLQSMNKALVGASVLGLSAIALTVAILAIPFLAFMAIPGIGMMIQMSFQGLAAGLQAFGNPGTAVYVLIGIALLGLLGIAMIPFAYALSLLTPLVQAFGEIIIGVFQAIPPIISAVATGIGELMGVITLKGILLLGLLGIGMASFGVGMMLATPGLVVLQYIGAPALASLMSSLQLLQGGNYGEQLIQIAAGMGAMGLAGVAMLFGAPGFIAMSYGLVVFAGALMLIAPLLPVIEKLAQLGIIGDVSVGEGGDKKGGGGDDDENVVVAKLDELISLIRGGGKVVMDGREVGKVIQLASGPLGS